MKQRTPSLYRQVVSITREYLGPAADRFISRQIESHLNIKPDEFNDKDLKELIVWIRLAMNLMITDTEVVKDYLNRLRELSAD